MQLIGVDVTSNSSTPQFTLGQLYFNDEGKAYRYVKLLNETATVAGVSGDAVAYLASPVGATERWTVVTDNTDAATKPVCAGLLNATVTGATGTAEYVWVQCQGPATANQTIAGTPADGDGLFLSTTDKTLTLSTAADDPVCAYAIDESAKFVNLLCP
jgi:hypothetical protein